MVEDLVIETEVRRGLGILTLSRPAALNAITLPMVRQMHAVLRAWMADPSVSAVLLRGAGEKAFCAGGDIRAIYDSFKAGNDEYMRFFAEEYALDHAIATFPKPCVALMDGYVMGGGMGLAQGCAVRIVTERTRMAMPEVGIGYFPDVGGSYFLPRLPGSLGLYLGLTGVQIRAADALYSRLADLQLTSADIEKAIDALADADWSLSPADAVASALVAMLVPAADDAPLASARQAIDQHFSQAGVPAILQSLQGEQRPEHLAWAQETLAVMQARSPIAMSVTWEQLQRGATMSLAECLAMELEMDRRWLPRGDLVEGVRALLVDKDRKPRWNPAALADVDQALVDSFFAPAGTAPLPTS